MVPFTDASEQECIRLKLDVKSDALYVSFSSHNVYQEPVFEFARALAHLPVRQVLLRDPYRLWYHRGVPGVGPHLASLREFLVQLRSGLAARRTVTLGTSAGAYAAILFGVLLPADEVLAFAPQTKLTEASDSRTPHRIEALHALADPSYLDLRELLVHRAESWPRVQIFFSADDPLDVRHAEHLGDVPNVSLRALRCEGHRIIPELKKDGRLQGILRGPLLSTYPSR